jgi:nephrocystin-3
MRLETGDAAQRVVRVFVSSTFRDMQAEREELVKRIFPELRKLCEQRGVTWGEVDLRWGVTEEQKAEGKVLPICLAEIQGCRPYFIGLLGERYGWVPEEIPQELIEREPWLSEHRERSVTELEILHGVLNDPEMADHTLFYFRNPSYIESLPEAERDGYREVPSPEEVAQHGQEEAKRRAEERAEKLRALKSRIRESGLPLREEYPDPHALGQHVLEDLGGIIERLYPAGSEPDPLDREAAEHDALARSRAEVYIGGEAYFERLDRHVAGEGEPLVVVGDSGLGKSALLANWALRHRAAHPGVLVLMHFIGASPRSAEWAPMLRRIMGELARRFEIEGEIPDDPAELRVAFANWLHMAAERGRVVLILDALNQLEDREGAPDLVWLPPVIPANVRLVCSTLPGRPLEELRRRGWPTLEVEPLAQAERERLVIDYLGQYRKALARPQVERIAAAPQSANPLYLRALLEELRLWGRHETLEEAIDRYLGADGSADLYKRILARYEADYERDRSGLVGDAMTLLWAARRGLSEAELLEVLGTDGEPLPSAYFSPLYLAAEQSLVSRAGLLGFSHDYLREAIGDRYLPTEEQQRAAHLRLADYFEARDPGMRRLDELPWQLVEASAWERLGTLLSDLPFLESAWDHDEYEVKAYWARLEANSPFRLVESYRPVREHPERHGDYLWTIGSLLKDTGHLADALPLREHLVEHYRELGDQVWLQASLGNQALILAVQGQVEEALALHEEAEQICRELGHLSGLSVSLGNQALLLYRRGELEKAMALHQEEERICHELGDRAGLSESLGNQALILKARGDLEEAMALQKEKERICRELGDRTGISMSLANQGLILHLQGQLDEAMALLKEQERICRELGDRNELQRSLGNQALILKARGELEEALALQKEKERICRELGDRASLQVSLGNQAMILYSRGELEDAMALLKEQERICRELGDQAGLQTSLGSQALILTARGELDEAMALHEEEERICRELGDRHGLHRSLGNQALIMKTRGNLDEAMTLLTEQERICRELGDRAGLQASLGNRALIFAELGDLDEAMAVHQEEERICRELGDRAGLQVSLGNQAMMLCQRGELDQGLTLLKEQERICRELDHLVGLATSLANQAVALCDMGRAEAGLPLVEEGHRLCDDHGLALVDRMRVVQDYVRSRMG